MTYLDPENEQYYQKMHQRHKQCAKRYYNTHKKEFKKYYDTHKKEFSDKSKKYYATHKKKYNDKAKNRYHIIRSKLFEVYGAECSCCGESTKMVLQLHHINHGSGKKERKKYGNLGAILKAITAKDSKNYTILCPTCHYGVHKNHGICPVHKSCYKEQTSH
jgi:hypothetical protein